MSTARDIRERDFHNEWAKQENVEDIQLPLYFESCASPENRQIIKWLGDIKGKSVLELGAGRGEASVYFAQRGAQVVATDISEGMLEVVDGLARQNGTQVQTRVCSATDLSNIAEASFDYVYAANLLHHVDIDICLREVHRVLKPGGEAYFWDPILYNPVIQVYRQMAKAVRTEDEHPLTRKDLVLFKKYFVGVDMKFFWLTSLLVFLKYFLVDRLNPNEVRYWKKVVEEAGQTPWLENLHRLDASIFQMLPPMRYLAWNVALRCRKR